MNKISVFVFTTVLIAISFVVGFLSKDFFNKNETSIATPIPTPLSVYSFEDLKNTQIAKGEFSLEEKIRDEEEFSSSKFLFSFKPNPSGSETKKTSGLINIPKITPAPLILMFRGYVDPQNYQSGTGTKNAAEFFANNGFITVAPDFLGYADSDENSANIFESRFQTYTTALTLLKSVSKIPGWDEKNLFIWGHSNGGQIAITTLEISGENIPTVLWAPVTKPFPYSILYYTDESDDKGKLIRKELSEFENTYDVDKFSLANYLEWITAPINLNQGSADTSVPQIWSDEFVDNLKNLNKVITYNKYPGSDHNMMPTWDIAINNDLIFFKSYIKN